jgi:hypothetical protein
VTVKAGTPSFTGSPVVTMKAASTSPSAQIAPNSGVQGAQKLPTTVTGINTHFVNGTTVAYFGFGPGIRASVTVDSPTSMKVYVDIPADTPPGAVDASLMTGGEMIVLPLGFTVVPSNTGSSTTGPPF